MQKRLAEPLHFGVAPLVFFVNIEKNIMRCIEKHSKKASAFLPRYNTRKDPVFSDRVLVAWVNKKIFWLCSAYPFIFAAHPLSLPLKV